MIISKNQEKPNNFENICLSLILIIFNNNITNVYSKKNS